MSTSRLVGIVCGLSLLACVIACGGRTPRGTAPASSPPKADEALQVERRKLLDDMQRQGVMQKLEGGESPRLWVGPKFLTLSADGKRRFVEIAYAYHYELPKGVKKEDVPATQSLHIWNSTTGKRLGMFSPFIGLDLE
jgi:hypothetical protein